MKLLLQDYNKEIENIIQEVGPILENKFVDKVLLIKAEPFQEIGYRISPQGEAIHIFYHTRIDFCRALFVLCSLEEPVELTDQRVFEEFGVMVDVSRNAVLKVETVKLMIRLLALMGYSYIGLYMEDTLRVEGEPYMGYMRGAFNSSEIRSMDEYATIFGMELRPFIQTLAHYNQITRYEDYQSCLDVNDILLIGEDRTYEFLERVIKTVSDQFTCRKINIGMDEAHMVGLGKYLDRHGYEKRFDIMEKHLNKVFAICSQYNLEVEMWSDMFFRLAFGGEYYVQKDAKLPTLKIPKDVKLVYWDYYSCDQKKYDEMLKQHLKITDQVGFAGGAWKWTGFAPHNNYSIEAGKAALSACRNNNIPSVVITAWGDNGSETSIFSILPTLFANANLAYTKAVNPQGFENLTGIALDDYLKLDMSNPHSEVRDKHNNASKYLLYNDALYGTFDSVIEDNIASYYEKTEQQLRQCQSSGLFGYIFETQADLCNVLKRKANLGKRIKEAYDQKDVGQIEALALIEIPALLIDLDIFYTKFKIQWMRENKAFGFEVQSIRIGGLKQRLDDIKEILLNYIKGNITVIEELEVERLPYGYSEGDKIENLDYNLWSSIVTPSVMG